MRLIDADALKADLMESKEKLWEIYNGLKNHIDKQICGGEIGTFTEVILRIKDAPTIDAVPVVRCGECARRDKLSDQTDTVYCLWHLETMYKTDFCSYGERKGGGT